MSFKEVSQLRKEGRLDEATTMARNYIAQSRDVWSCRALFWCLNDLAKNADMEQLSTIVEEMNGLMETMGDDDVAATCLQRIQHRNIPHYDEVRKAGEEAKTPANANEVYRRVLEILNRGELHEALHTDFAWIIYRALHADTSDNVEYRKGLLETYKMLTIERPSLLHSLILGEAVRVEKEWPQMFMFTEFIAWWGLENLTDGDWERFETEAGNKMLSRVEKLIYLYTKEVMAIPTITPSEAFMQVLATATHKWSGDDNLIRCHAMMLAKLGNTEEAITLYKRAITLTSGQKTYLWNELANIVSDIDLQIGLLSKALQLRVSEEFLGKIRIGLASRLCTKGLYSEAQYEIEKVCNTYRENDWNIPSSTRDIAHLIPEGTLAADNATQYSRWAHSADEFLYSELPSVYMVKVSQKEETQERNGRKQRVVKWMLIDGLGNVVGIKPRKFNLGMSNIGDCFEVKKSDGKIVVVTPVGSDKVNWRKEIQGTISIKQNKEGKTFGFVDNYYVPGSVIRQVKDGDTVQAIAIFQEGKWRCVAVRRA